MCCDPSQPRMAHRRPPRSACSVQRRPMATAGARRMTGSGFSSIPWAQTSTNTRGILSCPEQADAGPISIAGGWAREASPPPRAETRWWKWRTTRRRMMSCRGKSLRCWTSRFYAICALERSIETSGSPSLCRLVSISASVRLSVSLSLSLCPLRTPSVPTLLTHGPHLADARHIPHLLHTLTHTWRGACQGLDVDQPGLASLETIAAAAAKDAAEELAAIAAAGTGSSAGFGGEMGLRSWLYQVTAPNGVEVSSLCRWGLGG